MDVTGECISHIFELREIHLSFQTAFNLVKRISYILELKEILLSFQTCFSLVNAAVVCAILECNIILPLF